VCSVRIEVPHGWPWFSGTGTIYAHTPDGRSGFQFQLGCRFAEDSLNQFVETNRGPCHRLIGQWDYGGIADIQADPVHAQMERGFPMLVTSGTFWSHGETVDYAAATASVPDDIIASRKQLPEPGSTSKQHSEGAVVMATSLDGREAAVSIAKNVLASCFREPEPSRGFNAVADRLASEPSVTPPASTGKVHPTTEEHRRILDALAACDGNQTRAAIFLGMSRRAFVLRLHFYGVSWTDF
jgi:Bacterial regulatory protein, Fis family